MTALDAVESELRSAEVNWATRSARLASLVDANRIADNAKLDVISRRIANLSKEPAAVALPPAPAEAPAEEHGSTAVEASVPGRWLTPHLARNGAKELGPSADATSFAFRSMDVSSRCLTGGLFCLESCLPHLISVDISLNRLSTLDGFEALPALSTLVARGNRLTSVLDYPAPRACRSRLRRADLRDNLIVGAVRADQRARLRLRTTGGCSARCTATISQDSCGLTAHRQVEHLRLDSNQLSSLDGVEDAAELRVLTVSGNALCGVRSVRALGRLCGEPCRAHSPLTTLDLSGNQIDDLPPLQAPCLTHLALAHNRLDSIDRLLRCLGAAVHILQTLSLTANPLSVHLGHGVYVGSPHVADDESRLAYRMYVARRLPALQLLDGIDIPTEIASALGCS